METLLAGLVFLASLTAGSGQTSSQICPSRRYHLRQANGTRFCYLYVQSPVSYAAANRTCVRDGAILLTIGSSDENIYIRNTFFNDQEFWIGLNDISEEGTFRWENSSAGDRLSYTNWSSMFPFDNRASRDCVKFASDGWRVHNLPCGSSRLPFVCKSNSCSSNDGEVCLELVTMALPTSLADSGGVIAAIVIILLVVVAVVVIVVILVCLWKFKNDLFNRFCCWCCGGADRSKVRNLQQENQRLRQQLSQHRLSVSGRMPPGQFSNALAGVPDGRGGLLPPIKQQPVSPTTAESRLPFLNSSLGGSGPPPLSIQRPQRTVPGPFIGGRPTLTAPAGGLPRGLFPGIAPVRPVRQSLPTFGGNLPQTLNTSAASRSTVDKPVTPATLDEEDESESSEESEQEERTGPQVEGVESQAEEARSQGEAVEPQAKWARSQADGVESQTEGAGSQADDKQEGDKDSQQE